MSQLPNDSAEEGGTDVTPEAGEADASEARWTDASEAEGDRGPSERSLDVIFRVLARQRRRDALYVLYRHPGSLAVAELADEVASVEGTDPERVRTSLHHVHLPKLVDAGVAEYDAETGTVRLADHSDWFRRFLVQAAADEGRLLESEFEG